MQAVAVVETLPVSASSPLPPMSQLRRQSPLLSPTSLSLGSFFPLVFLLFLLSSPLFLPITARNATEWKSRTIYQLLTDRYSRPSNESGRCTDAFFCGGNFQGIIDRLDYIQAMGFNALWISPIVTQAPNGFHGYWAVNLFQIDPHWGTGQDLKALSEALHARDMWLMVDVVGNHMASLDMIGGNVSALVPFNDPTHYHDCHGCPADCNIAAWDPPNATQIEHCRIAGLLDLDQDNAFVRSTLLKWIRDLVRNYSIDGLRIDTFPLVKGPFWVEFIEAAGVYAVGEVDTRDVNYTASWQRFTPATLSYPLFWNLRDVFTGGRRSMQVLYDLHLQYAAAFSDVTVLTPFADNHDNPRFLHLTKDPATYRSVLTYVLTTLGIPIVYYGTEQGFDSSIDQWSREPLWITGYNETGPYFPFLAKLVKYRTEVKMGYEGQTWVIVRDDVLGYVRGNTTLVVLTQGGQGSGDIGVALKNLPWQKGTQLVGVLDDSQKWVVSEGGTLNVTLSKGEPLVLRAVTVEDAGDKREVQMM